MEEIKQNEGIQLKVDLEKQQVTSPGGLSVQFNIDPFRKECLQKGLDDISWTLQHESKIRDFEANQKKEEAWLWSA